MASNKKNQTSITPDRRKEMPPRGRGAKTLILESIREKAVLGLSKDASKEDTEKAVFGFMAESAFNPTPDTAAVSNTCLGMLLKKGWPDVKAVDPVVEFEFDENLGPAQKADQILKAISNGELPPSTGVSLLSAMSSVLKILEVTELKEEVDLIKEQLGLSNE